MTAIILTEELYKDLIKYHRIYENMVSVKKELSKFIFKNPLEKWSTGSELEDKLYELSGGYTIGEHVRTLEEKLKMYLDGMERIQRKYPEMDLRYLTELKNTPYTTSYNYFVYAKKQKNSTVQFIAEWDSKKHIYNTKKELIEDFAEKYSYLHKEKTFEEVKQYFEELFKYVN